MRRPAQPPAAAVVSLGVLGDASLATPEKGEAALDHGARAFVELLEDVKRFELPA